MNQNITRTSPEYEYIGRTYCLVLDNQNGGLIYMNGLRHREFPLENSASYVEFLTDIYNSFDELLEDYMMHYNEERNIQFVYGDIYYHAPTCQSLVLRRSSVFSEFKKNAKNYLLDKQRESICRNHPYSRVFYEWKGRFPTYQEYVDVLAPIRL